MITNVALVTVYCLDQQATHDFYVDVLGFSPQTDVTVGPEFRWLTVIHPSQPELELTFMTPGPPLSEDAAQFYRQQLSKGEMGGIGLQVDDCRATVAALTAKGVSIVQEPTDRPYGVEAVIRDNTGNWLVLTQPRPYSPDDFS